MKDGRRGLGTVAANGSTPTSPQPAAAPAQVRQALPSQRSSHTPLSPPLLISSTKCKSKTGHERHHPPVLPPRGPRECPSRFLLLLLPSAAPADCQAALAVPCLDIPLLSARTPASPIFWRRPLTTKTSPENTRTARTHPKRALTHTHTNTPAHAPPFFSLILSPRRRPSARSSSTSSTTSTASSRWCGRARCSTWRSVSAEREQREREREGGEERRARAWLAARCTGGIWWWRRRGRR